MAAEIATYHEVIDSLVDSEVLLIDVRDQNEVAESGSIPTSINIPLFKVQQELKLSKLAFVAKYQRNKPGISHKIIFYCKFGDLAAIAAEKALGLGYKNVKNYKAGYSEWIFKFHQWDEWFDPEKLKQQETYSDSYN